MGFIEDNMLVNLFYECMFVMVMSYGFFGSLMYYIYSGNGSDFMVYIGVFCYCSWMILYLLRLLYKLRVNAYLDKVIGKNGLSK